MPILLDTSVLGRLANKADTAHAAAQAAVAELHRRGEILHITAQNLVEFRNFATRSAGANGLGLSASAAAAIAASFEASFPLLEETPAVYPAWRDLVDALGVVGKQVHDARLVAVCHVHGVAQVLTFNVAHFARLTTAPPGFTVIDAASV
jgi:predicted nucleic acid-binding protein